MLGSIGDNLLPDRNAVRKQRPPARGLIRLITIMDDRFGASTVVIISLNDGGAIGGLSLFDHRRTIPIPIPFTIVVPVTFADRHAGAHRTYANSNFFSKRWGRNGQHTANNQGIFHRRFLSMLHSGKNAGTRRVFSQNLIVMSELFRPCHRQKGLSRMNHSNSRTVLRNLEYQHRSASRTGRHMSDENPVSVSSPEREVRLALRNRRGRAFQGRKVPISEGARSLDHLVGVFEHLRAHLCSECYLIVLLIDERPEEVTDMQRSVKGEVVTLAQTPLADLMRQQLTPFMDIQSSRVELTGPDIVVTAEATQAIGLTIHELATNAIKYGALPVPSGLSLASRNLLLKWVEQGGPRVCLQFSNAGTAG
jgi:hypothetical protein